MIARCGWCGRSFEAKTSRARYCCDLCRKQHNRAVRDGCAPPRCGAAPASPPEEDLAAAVAQLRGAISVLDAASVRGPSERRRVLAYVVDRTLSALREVGL